jgi:mutual gliding-motility protein MglA
MAVFNYLRKEIDAKIVYYGPAVCGKTTNLQFVHQNLKPDQRGKMVSLATNEDRTLFFDFLPVELQSVRGFKTRFHLYTVPGQAYYGATRRAVLTGADGVVFVVDSQAEKLDENLFSLKDMEENLRYYGKRIETIPLVVQYNKRDLPNILSIEDLNQKINRFNVPYYESVAITGQGVFETLTMACQLVLRAIEAGVDARRMAAAVPEGIPEIQPRAVGKGTARPETAKSQPEPLSKPEPVSRPELFSRSEPLSKSESPSKSEPPSKPEPLSKKVLRLEKEKLANEPAEASSETVPVRQPMPVGRATPSPGVSALPLGTKPGLGIRTPDKVAPSPGAAPSIPGGRPGLGLRTERRTPPPETPKPDPQGERPASPNIRLESMLKETESSHPALSVRTGGAPRPGKTGPLPETLPSGREGGAVRPPSSEKPIEKTEQEMAKPQESRRIPIDRKPVEAVLPEKEIPEALAPQPAPDDGPPNSEAMAGSAAGDPRHAETRSFLSRMFERRKAESIPKAEEEPVEKAAQPTEKLRIISCGQPRISPPAGLEIPLLLKVDGQERSLSFTLKIQLDPTGPKTE